jgi:hypothetical protein
LVRKASFCPTSKLIRTFNAHPRRRHRLSRIDHASFTFFFIWRWLSGPRVYPSSRTIGSGRKLRGGCAHIGRWLECFCLKSGVLGNEQPKQDHAVGLAVPITRRSCHLLLTAIFLACCLAAERRLPTHFTPFGGAFFQSTLFARVAVKSSTCATSTRLPAFHCSAWNAKLLHANSNVQ